MSAADHVFVFCAILATVLVPSVPSLVALSGAGPRYRRALVRFLCVGWSCAALLVGWLLLGVWALNAGPRWWILYRGFTLVLMGAWLALLPLGIRSGNRALRTARETDTATGTSQ